jgi:hypothetical protein
MNGSSSRLLSMAGYRGKAVMPRYTFTISQGDQLPTTSASDCLDDGAARNEACGMFADMARDISFGLQSSPDWQIEVTDGDGKSIFKIKLTAESHFPGA